MVSMQTNSETVSEDTTETHLPTDETAAQPPTTETQKVPKPRTEAKKLAVDQARARSGLNLSVSEKGG
jgi:hypothetical protein